MRKESIDSGHASRESTRSSSLDPKQKEASRTALGDVFPELASALGSRRTSGVSEDGSTSKRLSRSSTSRDGRFKYPILTIEEATNNGHSVDDRSLHGYDRGSSGDYEYSFNSGQATFGAYDETRVEGDEIRAATSLGFAPVDTSVDTLLTPLKKARQRPRSEQLLGGFGKSRSLGPADVMGMGSSRPGALYEDDDGVLSVLSAATNDLEELINVLDLQATPCTPDLTPLKPSLSPYASEPSSVVSNRLLNASLVSMDRMSSIASLRAFAAASASKMPSSFKKESDTRTQSNKTKSNSKSRSRSRLYATPALPRRRALASTPSFPSARPAPPTLQPSARLEDVSSLNSVAGSVRLGPYKQSRKLSGGPAGGLAGLFGGGSTTNMGKVEEGSLEVDEDDIVAEVMKAAKSKVKRDEEEKRKVDEKKKAEEAERQKAVEEESEKSRSPSVFARKHKHKRTMTPGPEPEPAPVFQPLQLPRKKNQGALPVQKEQNLLSVRPLAIRKLSKESPIRLKDAFYDDSGDENSQSDLFGTIRASKDNKRSSTSRRAAVLRPEEVEHKSPITKEARRMLGRSLSGSDVSAYQVEVDDSDPDSDVPEELRVILRKDDRSVKAYGTGRNARVFEQEEDVYSDEEDSRPHHRDEEEDDFDNDGEGYTVNHDDMTLDVTTDEWSVEVPRSARAVFTQQSVFSASRLGVAPTGSPLASSVCLGNSVGLSSSMASVATVHQASIQRSDCFSFVEQLESAFKTPAKVDLNFNSDMFKIGFGIEDAPPVPDLPKSLRRIVEDESSVEESVEGSMEGSLEESVEDSTEASKLRIDDDYSEEPQADLSISGLTVPVLAPRSSSNNIRKQSSRLEALKSSDSTLEVHGDNPKSSISSSRSRTSDGELNRSFRFGGLSSSLIEPRRAG
ncbi:hypothetical protein BKA70DRAFT_1481975 [Coprinopsis sp. MPI-PUGE-AT-0042]|nr:hypothetical protein BKA70DRAFT_1481975 [Coprinopsis sp. MPI-PUGE-AT-0042]